MIKKQDDILYNYAAAPPGTEFYLDRPRVAGMLKKAADKPLTTVIAGAGYGKTQAVSSYINGCGRNVIWLQLYVLDNYILRFWERLCYGFKPYNQALSDGLRALGYPETIAAFDKFLHLLAKGLEAEKNFLIVLDDFHFIKDKAVSAFIENLIYAQLKGLSIIIVSRKKPDINLAGMLSKGLLAGVTEDDLRFTEEETAAYYLKGGLELDKKTAEDIYLYTGGWIFAIYLTGRSLKKRGAGKINPVKLAKDDIFELIEKEIFSPAPLRVRGFLIRISILEVLHKGVLLELSQSGLLWEGETSAGNALSGETCLTEALTGLGQFISYDPFSDSFRMHQLFREYLSEREGAVSEWQARQLRMAAAGWCKNNDFKTEAICYYQKCGCYGEIFDIILSCERRVPQETADMYIGLIGQAPPVLLQERPLMQVARAYYLINNNKLGDALGILTELTERYESLEPSTENRSILGEAYILLAIISKINQDNDFERLFKKADEYLPRGSTLVDHRLNIAEGINITGIKNPEEGELKKYLDMMLRAMPHAARVMNGCNYGAEYLNAADSYFMTGDINNAEKNAFEAIFRAEQKQQYGIECMAVFILVRIYVSKGDYAKASGILKRMKERLNDPGAAGSLALYDIIEGWFFVKMGDTERVSKWIRHEEETRKMLPPVIVGREYLVRSDSLFAESRYSELLAFMELTDILYGERGILYAVIQNKITKAMVHHYMGNYDASIAALNESYVLSDPNKLIMQYIEYGNQMRTLIGAAKRSAGCKIPADWLDNIYKKASSYSKQLATAAGQYNKLRFGPKKSSAPFVKLSAREQEILNLLCRGLTRNEIADSCNLSTNTVKTILQNVYNKLGAVNSADAVHIAGISGLISDNDK